MLFNLALIFLQINNANKDNYKSFFDEFTHTLSVIDQCDIIENIIKAFNKKSNIEKLKNVFFDKFSKRYVLMCHSYILISSPNDITTINQVLLYEYFSKIIYFSSLERNVLIVIEGNELLLCDIENTKIINRKSIDKSLINCEKDIKYIELIEQEYFILFLKDKYLIYKINQEDKYPQFEFIKNLPHKYNNIYTVQNKFDFIDKIEIAFYEFNKEKIDFELLFKFAQNSKGAIKIDDMNNNKILIKYFKGEEKYVLNKYQIYDIKSQKQLHLIEFNTGPFNIDTLFL